MVKKTTERKMIEILEMTIKELKFERMTAELYDKAFVSEIIDEFEEIKKDIEDVERAKEEA